MSLDGGVSPFHMMRSFRRDPSVTEKRLAAYGPQILWSAAFSITDDVVYFRRM